jgi:hypothetical protein
MHNADQTFSLADFASGRMNRIRTIITQIGPKGKKNHKETDVERTFHSVRPMLTG